MKSSTKFDAYCLKPTLTAMRLWKLLLIGCSASAVAQTDPRVGLKPGRYDAGEAASNMRLLSATKAVGEVRGRHQLGLAFFGPLRHPGQLQRLPDLGHQRPDASGAATSYYCPASQSDVSVYKNLLIVSAESHTGRLDCGDKASKTR